MSSRQIITTIPKARMNLVTTFTWITLLLAALLNQANAHEMRPAYLELKEIKPETYSVYWKAPTPKMDNRYDMRVEYSNSIEVTQEAVGMHTGNAYVERSIIRAPGGLEGTTITIVGLSGTMTDALLRLVTLDGDEVTHRFSPDAPSYLIDPNPSWITVT